MEIIKLIKNDKNIHNHIYFTKNSSEKCDVCGINNLDLIGCENTYYESDDDNDNTNLIQICRNCCINIFDQKSKLK
jgi:hypothetical protein